LPADSPAAHRNNYTRHRFRRCIVPGTTRKHANKTATALQRFCPALDTAPAAVRPASTCGTLPGYGVSITWLTGQAPGTTPAAAVLPKLVLHIAPTVTSLEGVTPRAIVVCPWLPPGHSFRDFLSRFRGAEERSTSPTRRRWLFAVRHRLRWNWPARACAPLVVELFAVGFFRPIPEPCHRPGPACRQAEAPHAGLVERTSRDFHPNCLSALVRTPKAGFAPALFNTAW